MNNLTKPQIATKKPKVVVLFGAGASAGSIGINKEPPLGRDLHDVLSCEYPNTWGKMIPMKLKPLFQNDFEEGMDALLETDADAKGDVRLLLIDMALYFAQLHIRNPKRNLYSRFSRELKNEIFSNQVTVATTNYECLIESAYQMNELPVSYFPSDMFSNILKVHGSCNFFIRGFDAGGENLTMCMAKAQIDGPIMTVAVNQVPDAVNKFGIPAAMSLYSRGKHNITAPKHIESIQIEYAKRVIEAKLIIAIGCKPNLIGDTHLWQPIAKTNACVMLIGNEESCKKWIAQNHGEYHGSRFNECYDVIINEIREALLQAPADN